MVCIKLVTPAEVQRNRLKPKNITDKAQIFSSLRLPGINERFSLANIFLFLINCLLKSLLVFVKDQVKAVVKNVG